MHQMSLRKSSMVRLDGGVSELQNIKEEILNFEVLPVLASILRFEIPGAIL
jgi:hypothetical protein